MGKSVAGDFDRLIYFSGKSAAPSFKTEIRRQPAFLVFGEGRHAR